MKKKIYFNLFSCLFFLLLTFTLWVSTALASDLTSPSFIIRDPVVGVGGGYGTSGSFRVFQSLDESVICASSSSTFLGRFGFLYFPFVEEESSPGSGGGGGSSGSGGSTNTGVNFSGRAYPLSKVSILKDGQLVLSTIAGPDSNFSASLTNLASGNYTFSVYGEDKNGLRSSPFTFQIFITANIITNISGIFIAPTIAVDKSVVKRGDNIAIFGQSAQTASVIISVNSAQEFFENTLSDTNGIYLHNFDTSLLELGSHSTKSKAQKGNEISSFSNTVGFLVGTENVLVDPTAKSAKCDLNEDGRCNLVDFAIAAFWYKRPLSAEFIPREIKHLNGDGKVDLVDFSIMAFYWTG